MAEERLTDDPFKKRLDGDGDLPGFEVGADAEEYDEDLVGLTPSMLEKRLEERRAAEERMKEEYEKLLRAADAKRAEGDYDGAAALYADAAVYENGDEAEELLWVCRTHDCTNIECFCEESVAREFAYASDGVREKLLEKTGDAMRAELARCEEAAAPLRERVEAGMTSRRGAFHANRNYWLARFGVSLALVVLFGIGCLVAAGYLYRTQGPWAVVSLALCGLFAFASLIFMFLFSRKLYLAQRLVSQNEKLSSTEEGAALEKLENRATALGLALDGIPEGPEPAYDPACDEDYDPAYDPDYRPEEPEEGEDNDSEGQTSDMVPPDEVNEEEE